MAKRFGRNRRRHLRVDAQRGREAQREYTDRLFALNRSCHDWIIDIAQLYGENSAFLPDVPVLYTREGQEFPLTQFIVHQRSPDFLPEAHAMLTYEPMDVRMQILDNWQALSEQDVMKAGELVRLIQRKGGREKGEQFAYCLSQHQIMVTKDFEILGEMVKREMVKHLERHYGKQRRAA